MHLLLSHMRNNLDLLGGADIEMQSIKALLMRKGCLYSDHGLSWDNATLEQYKDVLELYGNQSAYTLVGVELSGTCDCSNYMSIDHHNALEQQLSSLEQVAQLLGVTLSRHEQLVAANDRGYIPAMQAMGATREEITAIRAADRSAQGITVEEERLAAEAVKVREQVGSLLLIQSQTERFAPICDALFPYRDLLIRTPQQWVYYGEHKADVMALFCQEIENEEAYYGGGSTGYVGIKSGHFSPAKIERQTNNIIKLFLP